MGRYLVGAYAASPCTDGWNPALEGELFDALAREGFVGGLELPFSGSLHPHDPEWLFAHWRADWTAVLTLIPGTMERLAADPEFGLASTSAAGRRRAVDFTAAAREAVQRLNDRLGRPVVRAVEIHSAPRPAAAVEPGADALRTSLDELRGWDWHGAVLSLEHCDAFVPGQAPAKGFLSLAGEIAAVRASRGATPVGIAVNWGRSAIEARDPEVPLLHLQRVREAGLLNGLVFSGAAAGDPLYGDWADRHAAFARDGADTTRLMTAARAHACLAAVKGVPLAFLGFKIQTLPKDLSVAERVAELRRAASILDAGQAA